MRAKRRAYPRCGRLCAVVGASCAPAVRAAPPSPDAPPINGSGEAQRVQFVDEDGDRSNLTGAEGHVLWCASRPSFGCRALQQVQLDLEGPCRLKVSFLLPWTGTDGGYAVVSQPPPGPEQQQLAQRLIALAQAQGVPVHGSAVDELEAGEVATTPMPLYMHRPFLELSMPPPVLPPPGATQDTLPVFIRIPGAWDLANITSAQVAIVERPEDCRPCAFSAGGDCAARPLAVQRNLHEFLDFEVPRCKFALAPQVGKPDVLNHTVCFKGYGRAKDAFPGAELAAGSEPVLDANATGLFFAALGRLASYPPPKVNFLDGNLRIGVRTFLNPGWSREIVLPCENCTRLSRLAVRAIASDPRCKGLAQQTLTAVAAAARAGQMPENVDMANAKNSKVDEIVQNKGADVSGLPCTLPPTGPCSGHVDDAFSFGIPQFDPADSKRTTFTLEGSRRLIWKERQALFHHRSALCFYPTEGDPNGWLVGFVAVHMDGGDLQAFIGFVCFFGVALPLVCLVTALLHYNKYERCKQHVNQLRLEYQRDQLERELATRRNRPAERLTPVAAAALGTGSSSTGPPQLPEGYWPLAGHATASSQVAAASSSSSSRSGGVAVAGPAAGAWRHEVIL